MTANLLQSTGITLRWPWLNCKSLRFFPETMKTVNITRFSDRPFDIMVAHKSVHLCAVYTWNMQLCLRWSKLCIRFHLISESMVCSLTENLVGCMFYPEECHLTFVKYFPCHLILAKSNTSEHNQQQVHQFSSNHSICAATRFYSLRNCTPGIGFCANPDSAWHLKGLAMKCYCLVSLLCFQRHFVSEVRRFSDAIEKLKRRRQGTRRLSSDTAVSFSFVCH